MIIKSYRTPTKYGHNRFRNHVFRGVENEEINLVQGVEQDAEDIFDEADREGRRYAIRHLIISPGEETSADEMMRIVRDLAEEFGFNPDTAVIVEHVKPRFGGTGFERHWHILVPDWDRDGDGRVLDTSHNFAKQEKISRLAEHRLGHRFIEGGGAHLQAVVAAMMPDHREVALALAAAFPGPVQPRFAFNHAEAQKAKRFGADLSEVRAIVRSAWRATLTVAELEAELEKHKLKIAVGDKQPPVWVVTNLAGETLLRVTKAAHVTKAEVHIRLGEPNGRRTEDEQLEPVRAPDERDRIFDDDDAGDPGVVVSDLGMATEPERGECGVSPEAFLKGLTAYADRIEVFARSVEREIIPKSVRLESSLRLVESRAEAAIARETNFTIPESYLLRLWRRKLKIAEERRIIARDRSMVAYDALLALRKFPEPGFFSRPQHRERLENAEIKYRRLSEKFEVANGVRDDAAKMVTAWYDHHQSKFQKRKAPLTTAAESAREKLSVVARTRALVRRDSTLLRFGPLGVYNLAWANHHRDQRAQLLWDGSKDIWGIPIEPPTVRVV
jgi:hypothetical protein